MAFEAEAWPPEEDFYDRFQRLWRRSSASAADIAQAVGLKNARTISNWAVPGREPSTGPLLALAEFFGVDAKWLLTGKGDAQGVRPPHAISSQEEFVDLKVAEPAPAFPYARAQTREEKDSATRGAKKTSKRRARGAG